MARELDVQAKVCKSAKRDGGYGRKISHKFVVGIPDLLVCLPPFAPCVIEMKDLGPVTALFDRQLAVTPKQALEMERISKPYEVHPRLPGPPATACVLVALVHRGEHRLVVADREADRLSHTYELDTGRWVPREPGGYYDLKPLLQWAGIGRIQGWSLK